MIYGIIFLVVGIITYLLRRRLGIPLLTTVLAFFLISWWSKPIAQWLISLGLGKPIGWGQALVEIIVILAIAGVSIYKSTSTGRGQSGRITEAVIFSSMLMIVLNGSIGYWFGLDLVSLDIRLFLANNHQILLTGIGVYSLYEILFRTE